MIPIEARLLMNRHVATARNTDCEVEAEKNIACLSAMIGYAAACGHLTPVEHANEWTLVKLLREQRISARPKRQPLQGVPA